MTYQIKYRTEQGIVYECTAEKDPEPKIEALKSIHGDIEVLSVTKVKPVKPFKKNKK